MLEYYDPNPEQITRLQDLERVLRDLGDRVDTVEGHYPAREWKSQLGSGAVRPTGFNTKYLASCSEDRPNKITCCALGWGAWLYGEHIGSHVLYGIAQLSPLWKHLFGSVDGRSAVVVADRIRSLLDQAAIRSQQGEDSARH